MRVFTDEQIEQLVRDAEDEQARRLPLELRRLYAKEDARASTETALFALLSSTHQQMHACARTLEGALRMIAPPQQGQPQAVATEHQRRRPRVLADEQPV